VTLTIAKFLDTRPTTFEPPDYTEDADENANDDVIERAEKWNECDHAVTGERVISAAVTSNISESPSSTM
jgi:hypothetical protein